MNKDMQFLIYSTPEENVSVNAVIQDETIWLTQKAMAELFGVNVPAISKHLTNIYEEEELRQDSTISKMEIVQNEGGRQVLRETSFYNLDAIISVGYRVNSSKATKFRIWATNILKEFISFVLARVFTLVLEMLIMFIFVTYLKLNSDIWVIIWSLVAQVVVIVVNYILSKLIIFKKKGNNNEKN